MALWLTILGTMAWPAGAKLLDRADMDPAVKPCDDFYQYANGAWLRSNPVPPAYSRWGSFDILREATSGNLRHLLEAAAADRDAPAGSVARKVGDFYASGMDESRIEAEGLGTLEPELARIAAIEDRRGLALALARAAELGTGAGFYFGSDQDAKDSREVIATLFQGGLGLPERDYYFKDDGDSVQLREAYAAFVREMFRLLGDDPATASENARTVMAVETELARASMGQVAMRDPDATYHRMPLAEVRKLMPHFPWRDFLAAVGLPDPGEINVAQPEFFRAFDGMFAGIPLADWRTYLRWHLIDRAAPALGMAFESASFDFYERTLSGAREMLPRWRRVLDTVEWGMGEAVGELYVGAYFSPLAKARALELIERLRMALRGKIQALDWMGPETGKAALRKLDAMRVKVGYPDRWRDYAALEIDRSSYLGNVLRASIFDFRRSLAKIGRPVDRDEWQMTPATVNAYYNASLNEIVFPAGILQPPFFDPDADDAVNYGGIGVVIGHEMTHGFDDQGRKYDAEGNLKDWWSAEDLKNFRARSEAIVRQFDGYAAIGDLKLDGELTQGENIADLGGVKIALAALETTFADRPEPEAIDGFDWRQRFFLSFAQVWRMNASDEERRLRARTDTHSPPKFRVNGTLANLPEFFDAFDCAEGGRLRRPAEQRVNIW